MRNHFHSSQEADMILMGNDAGERDLVPADIYAEHYAPFGWFVIAFVPTDV